MQFPPQSLPLPGALKAGIATGILALLGGVFLSLATDSAAPARVVVAGPNAGGPGLRPAEEISLAAMPSEADRAGSLSRIARPRPRPAVSLPRPKPRPSLVLASVSTRSAPGGPLRPLPRSAGIGLALALGPAERARLGPLLAEAADLLETPPTTLKGASPLGCLAISIYHEARDQPRLGQQAVAAVIARRAELARWGDTICDVLQPVQFSYLAEDRSFPPILERAAWRQALNVAIGFLINGPMPAVSGADHYHATYVDPSWSKSMREVMRIGEHVFYRDPLSGPDDRA